VVKKRGLGRRKAYYLVEVSRKFEPLPISRARLKKIGWTKLQIIGQHVTKDNVEELVSLAEQSKTKQLERKMQGDEPLNNAHCVLMYFSPKLYAEFEEALLKNGAERSGRGIVGKEGALISALRQAVPGLEKVQPPLATRMITSLLIRGTRIDPARPQDIASERPAAAQDAVRIAARSFPRPLGRAEARRRDHLFDLDSRQPLATRGLRRAAGGQAGRPSAAGCSARSIVPKTYDGASAKGPRARRRRFSTVPSSADAREAKEHH
jgi:hypothetical protein